MAISEDGSAANETNASSSVVDTNSALYIHPSDNPGMMLIPAQFDGAGYRSCGIGVMRTLSVKNKLDFIDESCKKPYANSNLLRQ